MRWHRENPSYGGQSGVNPVFLPGCGVRDRLPPWPDAPWLAACTGLTLVLWPEALTGPDTYARHPAYRHARRVLREAMP